MAQSNDSATAKPSTKSSPFNIIRSIESVGSEVLSLFGVDANDDASSQKGGPRARKKKSISVWIEGGQQVYNGDQRSCNTGNGVCSFTISMSDQQQGKGQKISALATYFPRQKRVQVEFNSALDTQFQNETGKVRFVVRRAANDQSDTNGTIVLTNKRLVIRNGEYEVTNNTVSFFID